MEIASGGALAIGIIAATQMTRESATGLLHSLIGIAAFCLFALLLSIGVSLLTKTKGEE
jgi:hypothetical protein